MVIADDLSQVTSDHWLLTPGAVVEAACGLAQSVLHFSGKRLHYNHVDNLNFSTVLLSYLARSREDHGLIPAPGMVICELITLVPYVGFEPMTLGSPFVIQEQFHSFFNLLPRG